MLCRRVHAHSASKHLGLKRECARKRWVTSIDQARSRTPSPRIMIGPNKKRVAHNTIEAYENSLEGSFGTRRNHPAVVPAIEAKVNGMTTQYELIWGPFGEKLAAI